MITESKAKQLINTLPVIIKDIDINEDRYIEEKCPGIYVDGTVRISSECGFIGLNCDMYDDCEPPKVLVDWAEKRGYYWEPVYPGTFDLVVD